MAIQAKASKKGITLDEAYIVVVNAKMDKYLRPVMVNNEFSHNESATQYSAKIDIYPNKDERDSDFGGTPFTSWFRFEHEPGGDVIEEAYRHIKTKGLEGWTLTDLMEV